ncbi:MAG TPA: hypothetical protein VGK99_02145 [Acidobacteriota bacterium]|jgi:uncharacterized membrane protein YgcG
MRTGRILGFLIIHCCLPLSAQTRALHWRSVDVQARLDSEGRLHVKERQAIVFTGDWNGGERIFNIRLGQELQLNRLTRVDPETGASHDLIRGGLWRVDHYDWTGSHTLRWRSRLPSEPLFNETTLVYLIDYTLSNILVPQAEGYWLDHDFCFADRSGVIEEFTLDLQLDPLWRAAGGVSQRLHRASLPPGAGVPVLLYLDYLGRRDPAGVRKGASAPVRYVLIAVLAAGMAYLFGALYVREKSQGRFQPLPAASSIDESWLNMNVFSMPPEVVGAAWDSKTSASEVAAVIARMVSEGKLHSSVRESGSFFKKDVLQLKLLVAMESLSGYERSLAASLFVAGVRTDTELIKKHYQSRGFDPAQRIAPTLHSKVKSLIKPSPGRKPPPRKRSLGLLLSALALLVGGSLFGSEQSVAATVIAGIAVVPYLFALLAASAWQTAMVRLFARALLFLLPLISFCGVVIYLLVSGAWRLNTGVLSGLTLLSLAIANSVANMAGSREEPERIALRRRLIGARRYFQQELKKPNPGLKDSWFPYLIAFGLGRNVDRWFRAHGPPAGTSSGGDSTWGTSASSTSSGHSPGSGWTGGGGAFGGAGASGTWAAAAGSFASGVSSPSSGDSNSGDSGGGSSGGDSSSGGGGGGGW